MFLFYIKHTIFMKLNILQIICLINYVGTFPNDLFDELWETNQSEPQPNNNPIESQPKIKVEPHEEQFDGRWQDESALKGIVKVEHEPHFGAVKVEGTVKMKHEFEWRDEESGEFKEQLEGHVKEEVQDGQAANTTDQKKIGYDDEYWSEDGYKSAPSSDDLDQDNSKKAKHLSDQNNSTDQDETVDEQQKIGSDQHKREIIQKFREMKEDYQEKNKRAHINKEWVQIERKISNGLGVGRTKLYKWIKELGLSVETKFKSKFSEIEKREILNQFDNIKSKCKQAKLKNISMRELDKKIAKKLGVCSGTIIQWKRKFGLTVSNKKFSDLGKREILKQFDEIKSKCKQAKLKNISMHELDKKIAKKLGVCRKTIFKWKGEFGLSVSNKISDATKIEILKKYAKIKRKNPKMTNAVITDILNISSRRLLYWKKQFKEEFKNL